ncbi:hypothetical protein GQ44DRAFT_705594 [Phaeosphaeriaceae sp. PMI808]|nr:hypothetical protein GQ44DRAFT_705594 [Phaeosphaeriaceae sp. PMI808]
MRHSKGPIRPRKTPSAAYVPPKKLSKAKSHCLRSSQLSLPPMTTARSCTGPSTSSSEGWMRRPPSCLVCRVPATTRHTGSVPSSPARRSFSPPPTSTARRLATSSGRSRSRPPSSDNATLASPSSMHSKSSSTG